MYRSGLILTFAIAAMQYPSALAKNQTRRVVLHDRDGLVRPDLHLNLTTPKNAPRTQLEPPPPLVTRAHTLPMVITQLGSGTTGNDVTHKPAVMDTTNRKSTLRDAGKVTPPTDSKDVTTPLKNTNFNSEISGENFTQSREPRDLVMSEFGSQTSTPSKQPRHFAKTEISIHNVTLSSVTGDLVKCRISSQHSASFSESLGVTTVFFTNQTLMYTHGNIESSKIYLSTGELTRCLQSHGKLVLRAQTVIIDYIQQETGTGLSGEPPFTCMLDISVSQDMRLDVRYVNQTCIGANFLPSNLVSISDAPLPVSQGERWSGCEERDVGHVLTVSNVYLGSSSISIGFTVKTTNVNYTLQMNVTAVPRLRLETLFVSTKLRFIQTPGWKVHQGEAVRRPVDDWVSVRVPAGDVAMVSFHHAQHIAEHYVGDICYGTVELYQGSSCLISRESCPVERGTVLRRWPGMTSSFTLSVVTSQGVATVRTTQLALTLAAGRASFLMAGKCLAFRHAETDLMWTEAVKRCAAEGMRLAVLSDSMLYWDLLDDAVLRWRQRTFATVEQYPDSGHFFEFFQNFDTAIRHKFFIGLSSVSSILPQLYKSTTQWLDGSVAYNVQQFAVNSRLKPLCAIVSIAHGRLVEHPIRVRFYYCATHSLPDYLCEMRESTSQRSLQSQEVKISTTHLAPPADNHTLPIPFVVCPDKHLTHSFLACDVNSACFADSSDYNSDLWWGRPSSASCPAPMTSLPPSFTCENGWQLVPYSLVCDYRHDCQDRSDETFCPFTACTGTASIRCGDTAQCFFPKERCDGKDNCLNRADEGKCDAFYRSQEDFTKVYKPPATPLPELMTLDLSRVIIPVLDLSIVSLFTELQTLNLSGSGVERVLTTVSRLPSSVGELDIRGCSISEFPRDFLKHLVCEQTTKEQTGSYWFRGDLQKDAVPSSGHTEQQTLLMDKFPSYFVFAGLCLTVGATSQRELYFTHDTSCPGRAVAGHLCPRVARASSLLHCAMQCSQFPGCVTFMRDSNLDLCRLCEDEPMSDCVNTEVSTERTYRMKVTPSLCQNGGNFTSDGVCLCPAGFTGDWCERPLYDCSEGKVLGHPSGVYNIQPARATQPFPVHCDMEYATGRTYITMRSDGQVLFNRTWQEDGFGDQNGDFWLGLQNLYLLTNSGQRYILKVEPQLENGTNYQQNYHGFYISNETTHYRMYFDYTTGNSLKPAGDSMSLSLAAPFSTHDADHDGDLTENCAERHQSGMVVPSWQLQPDEGKSAWKDGENTRSSVVRRTGGCVL
ncbi:hypothetical protein BaRGS_00012125, partial [Batillaria attramentaria]